MRQVASHKWIGDRDKLKRKQDVNSCRMRVEIADRKREGEGKTRPTDASEPNYLGLATNLQFTCEKYLASAKVHREVREK